jgi:uncharacterized C2H2 Zn-finger protein
MRPIELKIKCDECGKIGKQVKDYGLIVEFSCSCGYRWSSVKPKAKR